MIKVCTDKPHKSMGGKVLASVVEVDSDKNEQRALTLVTEFKYPKKYRSCH
jgi:hypothetical protein